MNSIYEIGLNGTDFQIGRLAIAETQNCLPAVDCDECGKKGVMSLQWRPDWNLPAESSDTSNNTRADKLDSKTISIEQFNRQIVPNVTGLSPDSRIVAGTYYGYNTIKVPVKATTSELKQIHLTNNQPIITGAFSHLCSSAFAEAISIDSQVRLVEITLRFNDGDIPYFVFCDRYVPAWSQEEWDSHGMTLCSSCGSIMYQKHPKTYTQKRIRKEWFEDGPSIVKSREHNCLLVNESMKSLLAPVSARIKFSLYGSW